MQIRIRRQGLRRRAPAASTCRLAVGDHGTHVSRCGGRYPATKDYNAARDSIVRHLDEILRSLPSK